MLFQRCFVYVETTSINILRLNLHFQPKFNFKTTLVHRRWIDLILSKLFQLCFANVETMSINVHRLNFHFQPNTKVETTLMNVDNQRCFNVDSTLMCLLGRIFFKLNLILRWNSTSFIPGWNSRVNRNFFLPGRVSSQDEISSQLHVNTHLLD